MARKTTASVCGSQVLTQRSLERTSVAPLYAPPAMPPSNVRLQAAYAEVVVAALEAGVAQPAFRPRKVRGIKDRLSRGRYSPTATDIARRLVGV